MWNNNDNTILYWYTEAEHPELPADCSGLLASFDVLEDAESLGEWDTRNVTNMSSMFGGCKNLVTLDVSNWDTGNVTNMNAVFAGCISIVTIDLSSWDTCNVTNMNAMFANGNWIGAYGNILSNIKKIIVSNKFVVDNVTNSSGMFGNCIALVGENGTTYNSSNIDKSMAHIDVEGNPGYFSAN